MTERWVKMVEKVERPDDCGVPVVSSSEVVKLLARQHRAMVRMVKKEATESVLRIRDAERRGDDRNVLIAEGHRQMCAAILAALAKQGKGSR